MAASLKILAKQLRKNHGVHLIPTFDKGVRPGTVIRRTGWNDITRIARLTDDKSIKAEDLGFVEGPLSCLLSDFNRSHEVTVGAAVDLLQPAATAKVHFKKIKNAVASFGGPVTHTLSVVTIEDALEADSGLWDRALGQHLASKRSFVVFQTICAKLSFTFEGTGSIGTDVQATALGNLKSVGLQAGWKWRNQATLESKDEVLIAVEMARYDKRKKILRVF